MCEKLIFIHDLVRGSAFPSVSCREARDIVLISAGRKNPRAHQSLVYNETVLSLLIMSLCLWDTAGSEIKSQRERERENRERGNILLLSSYLLSEGLTLVSLYFIFYVLYFSKVVCKYISWS